MIFKEKLKESYGLYLKKYANQAKATIDHKKYVIESFLSSLPDDASTITGSDVLKWQNQFDVTTNTLNGHIVILRQFLAFVEGQGLHTTIPTTKKYVDDYIPYLFTTEELQRLLSTADNNVSHSKIASTKTFCIPMIMRILASCGTRLSETLTLKWNDYDEESGLLVLRNTKGKKERLVPLHISVNKILKQYKHRFKCDYGDCEYLFPNDSLAGNITKQQFYYEFKKLCLRAGITTKKEFRRRGICAHCFRHTFAVTSLRNSLEKGIDISGTIPILSTYLGHERLQETEKYLKFSIDLFPTAEEMFSDYSASIFEEAFL